ncbi:Phospholipase D alpha 1 [Sesbania bispinosa]|nr:Phospholipase D alpha 1 [Sesbania bispinosa]
MKKPNATFVALRCTVFLCPRNPDDGGSVIQDIGIATMFTHHQKIGGGDSELPNGGANAWDVLYNFEQRWRKQGGKDLLVPLRDLEDVIITPSPVTYPDDHETWNVQLFRSIDGGAAFGFPETPEDAARAGLISGKDNIIDRSIQDAYINAIRRAKNFISLKINISLEVRRTMDMMYKDVIQALNAKGIEEDPRNYLTFFCLGNREVKKQGEYEPSESPEPDSDYMRAQEARRFMIYVHAKMMIGKSENYGHIL